MELDNDPLMGFVFPEYPTTFETMMSTVYECEPTLSPLTDTMEKTPSKGVDTPEVVDLEEAQMDQIANHRVTFTTIRPREYPHPMSSPVHSSKFNPIPLQVTKQNLCCIRYCSRKCTIRLRYCLPLPYAIKITYVTKKWDRICHACYVRYRNKCK